MRRLARVIASEQTRSITPSAGSNTALLRNDSTNVVAKTMPLSVCSATSASCATAER
jgi:hypothetical protein